MSLAFYILAAEEDAIYKLVPFLIILVIWALGAIASAKGAPLFAATKLGSSISAETVESR